MGRRVRGTGRPRLRPGRASRLPQRRRHLSRPGRRLPDVRGGAVQPLAGRGRDRGGRGQRAPGQRLRVQRHAATGGGPSRRADRRGGAPRRPRPQRHGRVPRDRGRVGPRHSRPDRVVRPAVRKRWRLRGRRALRVLARLGRRGLHDPGVLGVLRLAADLHGPRHLHVQAWVHRLPGVRHANVRADVRQRGVHGARHLRLRHWLVRRQLHHADVLHDVRERGQLHCP
mmetsp:Transcript_25093/g.94847  ORF Transcript_25093/g.94847 Transcript_25093/m.94847 type:complete len:227 (-) Transcript_25093:400-1080(-)